MKKYLVLYMAPIGMYDEMMKNTTPDDQKKGTDSWNQWMSKHAKDLTDPGAPLGKNKRITAEGMEDKRNEVAGYSVVKADSPEQVHEIMKDNPHLEHTGTWLDVVECMPM